MAATNNGYEETAHEIIRRLAQEELDAKENARIAEEERDIPISGLHTPLDVFGQTKLVGSPPLPMGVTPQVLEVYACDVAERLGVDVAMVALPMLAVTAACIDDRIQIQPLRNDTSWTESARLWVAFLADPGAKKSPALAAALAPIKQVEAEWFIEDQQRLKQYALEKSVYDKQLKNFVAEMAAGGGNWEGAPTAPERPIERRKRVSDTTIEALGAILADNVGGLIEVHDELSGWFGNFDAYRQRGSGKDRSLYLEAFNGGQQIIDRVGRGRIIVPNWSLSLVGGIQPGPMRRLAGEITDDGLSQRFLVVFTERTGEDIDRAEDGQARTDYELSLSRLLHWDIGGPDTRHILRLSNAAHTAREHVNYVVRLVTCMPWVSAACRSHLAKWEGIFPRLLLTFHVLEKSEDLFNLPMEIEGDLAHRVAAFMLDYLLPHALRYYDEILGGATSIPHARWIAGHILAHGIEKISVRDIGRVNRELRGDTSAIMEAMSYLEIFGWVTEEGTSRKDRLTKWQVNAGVHDLFAERAGEEKERRAAVVEKIREARQEMPELLPSNIE